MKKDLLDNLFEELDGTFDLSKTPEGHQKRFMDRLNVQAPQKKLNGWWKPLSIAASILLLVSLGLTFQNNNQSENELANLAPELADTESFFVQTINSELETLKSFTDAESQKMVDDALERLEYLEVDYKKLKLHLKESGGDKRVISAMIENFQNRIDLLQQVIEKIEHIKTLKAQNNENII